MCLTLRHCLHAGHTGIGHVRYPTAGSSSAQEAQPFFVNSPLGIYLIHNGNVTNTHSLRQSLEGSQSFFNRHLRTDSDSEVQLLLQISVCLCAWPVRPSQHNTLRRVLGTMEGL